MFIGTLALPTLILYSAAIQVSTWSETQWWVRAELDPGPLDSAKGEGVFHPVLPPDVGTLKVGEI